MKVTELFDYSNSFKVDINNGEIKCIWIEGSEESRLDDDNSIPLMTGQWAMIELMSGKKILITNSEWATVTILDATKP